MKSSLSVAPVTKPLYSLHCVACGKIFLEKQTVTNCLVCGGAMDVRYTPVQVAYKKLEHKLSYPDSYAFLKAHGLLPLLSEKLVSLKEGNTPLLHASVVGKTVGLKNLLLKFEGANPTGVFKDRGSVVEITKALELGAKAVTCASTGNMAASVAAYCAKAKLPCYVVIPEKTPMGKLAQAIAYGANVLKVRGDYSDCVRLSVEMAKHYNYYLAGDYVFRSEGQKAMAYELLKQMKGDVPDWVVVPVGCGTNLSAIYKGFKELFELGLTKKIPRFVGVQPQNVPTVVAAWRKKLKHYVPVVSPFTVASAVGIGTPLDDVKVLNALYDSKGVGETATEEEILDTQRMLGNVESVFVEPSGALPVAVLKKLVAQKVIKPDDTVVCVLTGNGLKDTQSIMSTDVDSPVIEPSLHELKRYFSLGLSKRRNVSLVDDKKKVLWKTLPAKPALKSQLQRIFTMKLSTFALEGVYDLLQSFQEKQKTICKGDVEYALETVLKMPEGMKKKMTVRDFSVHATQHQASEAWVAILFGNEEVGSRAKGVGPVDAIIAAIKDAIKNRDKIGAQLTYYNVEINTSGADAVVEVHLSLKGANGIEVTGEAASPDVIVASIKAFENAYNLLDYKTNQQKKVHRT